MSSKTLEYSWGDSIWVLSTVAACYNDPGPPSTVTEKQINIRDPEGIVLESGSPFWGRTPVGASEEFLRFVI